MLSTGTFRTPFAFELWQGGTARVDRRADDDESDDEVIVPSILANPPARHRKRLKFITRRPIWISRIGRQIDADEELIELSFTPARDLGVVRTEWVTKSEMSSRRGLVALSSRGLPIRDGNAADVEDYLDRAFYDNAPSLPVVTVASRSAMYEVGDGQFGWLLGDRWVGPSGYGEVIADPRVRNGYTAGYRTHGDKDAWFAMFGSVVRRSPVARWLCYSTFGACVLRLLQLRTFIIHHWAESGAGKSALLKFAMSAFGHPQQLLGHFNRTKKSFVETFKYVSDLPVAFDELQAGTIGEYASIIYALTLEKGRERSGQSGGLQQTIDEWRSIVRMTGEEPIIGNGKIDLGGQRNRVLQINDETLGSQEAEALHMWLDRRVSFGWGGLVFIQMLQQLLAAPQYGLGWIEREYLSLRTDLAHAIGGSVSYARCAGLAAIALSQMIAATTFSLIGRANVSRNELHDMFARAREQALTDGTHVAGVIATDDEDRLTVSEMALQAFCDHRQTRRRQWLDASDPTDYQTLFKGEFDNLFGVTHAGANNDEVWIIPTVARDMLKRADIQATRAFRDLLKHGILVPSGERGLTHKRALGRGVNTRVYVLKQRVFDAVTPTELRIVTPPPGQRAS